MLRVKNTHWLQRQNRTVFLENVIKLVQAAWLLPSQDISGSDLGRRNKHCWMLVLNAHYLQVFLRKLSIKIKSNLGLGLVLTLCGVQKTCVACCCYLVGFYKPPQFQWTDFKETLSGAFCCSPFRYYSVFEASVCAKRGLLWSSTQWQQFWVLID